MEDSCWSISLKSEWFALKIFIQDLDRDLRDFFSGVLDRLRLRLLLADLLLDFFLSRDRLLSRESLRSE